MAACYTGRRAADNARPARRGTPDKCLDIPRRFVCPERGGSAPEYTLTMTLPPIPQQRLANQHLTAPVYRTPAEVVAHLGAVQAQDYGGAKWAVAQRALGVTDAAVEQAFAAGSILRTHVLRPTWHFVTPADIRWMLALTAPRVLAASASYFRKVGLDDRVFKRSRTALTKALQGGKQLTRDELATVLARAGVETDGGGALALLLIRAELDGIICSGPRRGNQFTYALLEERAPPARTLERDEALLELTKRYFFARGPATLQDFAVWSGLTAADGKRGTQMAGRELLQHTVDGRTYWFAASQTPAEPAGRTAYLLPNYDEYFIGFKDRSHILETAKDARIGARENAIFANVIVLDGQVVGDWKRTLKKSAVTLELTPAVRLRKADHKLIAAAAQRYGAFLGLPVELA
jgi:hypothetical protein